MARESRNEDAQAKSTPSRANGSSESQRTSNGVEDSPRGGLVRRGRGRGRGRPSRRVVGVRGSSSNANSAASSPHLGPAGSASAASATPAVISPMLFAQMAVQRGVDRSAALSEYLDSFVTLPDDSVLSSLPKPRQQQPKHMPGAMTVPELPAAGSEEQRPDRAHLVADMKRQLNGWIDEVAGNVNRISLLRRRGMLRDSDSQALAAHGGQVKSEPGTPYLLPSTPLSPSPPSPPSRTDPAHFAGALLIPMLPPPLPVPEPKAREPRRAKTWRDQLLTDVVDRHKEITVTGRRRRAMLRKRSRQIEKQEDEKNARLGIYRRPEQAERAAREHQKRLAKWTVQQVMKKWTYVESIMNEQRQIEEDERRSKQDKRVLFNMLERSTQYLEEQRADFNPLASISNHTGASSTAPSFGVLSDASDSDADTPAEESDVEFNSESDSDSGAEMRDIIAEQRIDVEELRRRYFESSAAGTGLRLDALVASPPQDGESGTDDDAAMSPEQTDEEFSSESSSEDTDSEMAGLADDRDISIEALLKQYWPQEQTLRGTSPVELRSQSSGADNADPETGSDAGGVQDSGPGIEELATAMPEHLAEQPFLLRGSLREYQRQGLDWLSSLHQHGLNGILADEMGLGKTIQTIALLAHLACHEGIWGPHLVIVPTSVLLNWEQEFHRWLPGFKVLTYYGGRAERKLKRKGWSKPNAFHVCVTSYQLAIQDSSVFKRKPWYYMILDEAQAIKNFRSQRWQTLLGFKSASRLLLTGTPLQNSLIELWSLMYFLMPKEFAGDDSSEGGDSSGFAGLDRFREWFSQPLEKLLASQPEIAVPAGSSGGSDRVSFNTMSFLQGTDQASHGGSSAASEAQREAQQAVQKLHAVLRPHILRRLKQDVETQLPDKVEHVVYCRLAKRQRFLYDDFMSRAKTRETLLSGAYLGVMSCLMQLRKVCNHPDLFETRPIVTSWATSGAPIAAYRRTEDLVRRMLSEGQGPSGPADAKPWQGDRSKVWELRGLLVTSGEQRKDALACQGTRRLDATPLILRRGLKQAEALLQVAASEELSWDELQMRPYASKYRSVKENARLLEHGRCFREEEAWMRMSSLNAKRVRGLAQLPVYGAGTLRICSFVQSLRERSCDLAKGLVPTGQERLERCRSTIDNFVFATPRVVVVNSSSGLAAIYPHLRPENQSSSWIKDVLPSTLHVKRRVARRTGVLRPLEVRQQIAFPEPFLLQYDCGKLQALDLLLTRLVQGGHRALIFTQMTKVLDILEKWLNLHGYRYLRLDGATPVEQRWRLTERFNHDPKWTVFISSTRAGGLGINLTGADTVIFYDSDWNHAMDAQCQDRCHRIGQQREVHIYRLISERTIEEAIWRKQCEKRWLNHVVIQEGRFDPSQTLQDQAPAASSAGLLPEPQEPVALGVGDWYELANTVLAQSSGTHLPAASTQPKMQRPRQHAITDRDMTQAISAAEDEADAAALKVAISEVAQADALDLGDELPAQPSVSALDALENANTQARGDAASGPGGNHEGNDSDGDGEEGIGHVDDYMFRFLSEVVFKQDSSASA